MGWTIARTGKCYATLTDAHDDALIGDLILGDDDQTFKVRSRTRLDILL